ncbi:hypothetical protein DPMN_163910 [Dreissena polymorpha]|uniref:Uncharacterized protein n=1 Tax=Dreissena polymorpha TaxID=45954 RepID=A0A9D4EWQ4_DREPO|nr:hypothetical protein DPMN_163910 [Dreissena polymorpha]
MGTEPLPFRSIMGHYDDVLTDCATGGCFIGVFCGDLSVVYDRRSVESSVICVGVGRSEGAIRVHSMQYGCPFPSMAFSQGTDHGAPWRSPLWPVGFVL